jgi:hypothetical protein
VYRDVDRGRANQYRLGIIGYEMLVGSKEFRRLALDRLAILERMQMQKEPTDVPPWTPIESVSLGICPEFLSIAIARMIHPNPDKRFETFIEAVDAIAHRDLDVEIARESYRRIIEDKANEWKFFKAFYDRFLQESPAAARAFKRRGFPDPGGPSDRQSEDAKVDWPRQYTLLKDAIVLLLAFKILGESGKPTILDYLLPTHKKFSRKAYDAFRTSLILTVLEFDKKKKSKSEQPPEDFEHAANLKHAWEMAIGPGIDYMIKQ